MVVAAFAPVSFAATSSSHWWVLGSSSSCKSPPCTAIVRTDNAGRSFSAVSAPKTGQVHELRFADPRNGFAFGPELWSTHDGARAWNQVDAGGSVVQLAAGDGWVYAVVRTASGSGRLLRSPVGRDDWHSIGKFAGFPIGGLSAGGATVTVETQDRSARYSRIYISKDSGEHWRPAGNAPPSIACALQAMLPVIWEDCSTGMLSGVWRSADAGAHLRGVGGDATRSGKPAEPNSASFAAASPAVAVYGYEQLWRTTDGGGHWRRVPGTGGAVLWSDLAFTDAMHGAAVGQFQGGDRLYYTSDGGRSYRRVRIGR